MAVRMELSRVFIREMTDMQIIELSEVGGSRTFPIVIGLPEAFAIERRLKGLEIPRPQTHDLLASTIRALGGTLTSIEIHDLKQGTFFAKLVIERGEERIEVDSRPSDAIALGVAEEVPIFVAEEVLEQASNDPQLAAELEQATSGMTEGEVEDAGDLLEEEDEDDEAPWQ
ncbi:MAG: bifunctional nuclease family protein [Phycisphaerae bacterium]|nr:bifunctional nuclease family protein [Phycisphaerae bacterium]